MIVLDLNSIVNSKDKLTAEQLEYILNKTDNQPDYLLLNYMEQRIIEVHGQNFIKSNSSKIQYIMGLIIQGNINDFYEFYSGCFEQYMEACGRNIKAIPGFNIIFIVLIHIAIKLLRKNKQ